MIRGITLAVALLEIWRRRSGIFPKRSVRQKQRTQQGHRAWEAEHRWTVRAKADYVFPYSKTGQIKAGYQYFSYSEDGDYSMQFWNPDTKEFFWRDDIYNTFYFQQGSTPFMRSLGIATGLLIFK